MTHPEPRSSAERKADTLAKLYTRGIDVWVASASVAENGHYVYIVLRPDRIQAWREVNEMEGRTLMHVGAWVV